VDETKSVNAESAERFPSVLPRQLTTRLFFHLGVLISLLSFGSPFGGLIEIPVSFLLKNKLHLGADELAHFRFLSAVPLYLSFAFGFLRDWDPLHLRDRGLNYIIRHSDGSPLYRLRFHSGYVRNVACSPIPIDQQFLIRDGGSKQVDCMIGRRHAMSGQISAMWNFLLVVPSVTAFLVGGMLSEMLEAVTLVERRGYCFSSVQRLWEW
jgi:hypothetical protein